MYLPTLKKYGFLTWSKVCCSLSLRKAITYGKLVEGVDVCKFGKQWVVSMAAMKREYGEPRI